MKRVLTLQMILALALALPACAGVNAVTPLASHPATASATTTAAAATAVTTASASTAAGVTPTTPAAVTPGAATGAGAASIALKGSAVTVDGPGAAVSGSTVAITAAGTYTVSGTLTNGQIIVSAPDDAKVTIILDGANITCANSAPIYVKSADKVTITLAAGTANSATDGAVYVLDDPAAEEPSAAIFSKSDLTINGDGSLTVKVSYNHGIQSKDDLKITGGTVNVMAKNDALKGRDSVTVKNAALNLKSGGDGIQSNNDEDADKGWVLIESGTLNITAGEDGVQAETSLTVSAGSFTITSGGGSSVKKNDNIGSKGLKAGAALIIEGGTFKIDASDDALHSNGTITVNGGTFTLSAGDDAVHADKSITVNGGDIAIARAFEGFESQTITMNGGNVHVVSSDDGVNGVSATVTAAAARPGGPFDGAGDSHLYINGGYLYLDAGGDGIDVNGPIDMTGGTVIVNGPTRNDNGALDYTGAFKITGGLLVAVGSAGMAQAPGTTSTQNSVSVNLSTAAAAGTLVSIVDAGGGTVVAFKPSKAYQSVVVSSTALKTGASYIVYTGGSVTGTAADGLYTGGSYTPGTQAYALNVTGVLTTAGAAGRMGGPGGGGFPLR